MKHDQTNQIVSGLFDYNSQAIFVGLQSGNDFRMLTYVWDWSSADQASCLCLNGTQLFATQLSSTPFL